MGNFYPESPIYLIVKTHGFPVDFPVKTNPVNISTKYYHIHYDSPVAIHGHFQLRISSTVSSSRFKRLRLGVKRLPGPDTILLAELWRFQTLPITFL